MSDDLIERLRAGLEGVTPDPWGLAFNGTGKLRITRRAEREANDVDISEFDRDEDAEFLVLCSPGNIRALLDALAAKDIALSEMVRGLSALVHCQSPLSRKDMREAAASLLADAGTKPVAFGDQSPFVALMTVFKEDCTRLAGRLSAAEAQLERVKKALEPFSTFSTHKASYVELPVTWCIDAARALASIQDEGGER